MIYDVQKASVLKRIVAWMLDMILLVVLITGVASLVSVAVDMSGRNAQLQAHYDRYEAEYGVIFEITQEEYLAYSQQERDQYDAAYEALIADDEVLRIYNLVVNLTLIITSVSILVSFLMLEFAVPLFLKNGQTVGKKIFGLAVMRTSGVRINPVCLFIRTVLGKCTVETMVPVMIAVMLMLGITGIDGTILVLILALVNVVMLFATANRCQIHDKLADTVVVDMASQLIFDSEEELMSYKTRVAAEEAKNRPY